MARPFQGPQNFLSFDSSRGRKFPLSSLIPYLCGLHFSSGTLARSKPSSTEDFATQLWKAGLSPLGYSAVAVDPAPLPPHVNLQMSIARKKSMHTMTCFSTSPEATAALASKNKLSFLALFM